MSKSQHLQEITLFKFYHKKLTTCARFKYELTPENYGIQRFITTSGEVCIMNLIQDGFSDSYKDIRRILDSVKTERKKKNNFIGAHIGTNDAIRYFCDLSPEGNYWFWEHIKIKVPDKVIEKQNILADNLKITFNNWNTLSENKKKELMQFLLDNPIDGKENINNYIYD
jgi:hypothetical protein